MNAREGSLGSRHPAGSGVLGSREMIELLLLNAELEAASLRDPEALEAVRLAVERLRTSLGAAA